jgi:hypothetical protein
MRLGVGEQKGMRCRPKKEVCGQETLQSLIALIREEREARKTGQTERKCIDQDIFDQLKALHERNKEVGELYADIKKMIAFWKKYGKPFIGFISVIGGAAIVVFKLWRLIFPK